MMYPCPPDYCCSFRSTICESFDTCNRGRSGILCGSCSPTFVQSFMTSACVPKQDTDINIILFTVYFLVLSNAYTILFTFLPKMVECLKAVKGRCKKNRDAENQEPMTETDCAEEDEEEEFSTSAYITLVIFFFQIASMVHVENYRQSIDHRGNDNTAKQSLFAVSNFHFLTTVSNITPMEDLTYITKMVFNLALKINIFVNLIWLIVISKCCSLCTKKNNKSLSQPVAYECSLERLDTPSSSNGEKKVVTIQQTKESSTASPMGLSFKSLVKIGFIKLLKLNFTALLSMTVHLIHCVKIGDTQLLYRYGDQTCYTWWQYTIMGTLLPLIVLFPLSFGISLDLLKERKISTNIFLLSSALPPVAFWLRAKTCIRFISPQERSDEEEICSNEILDIEENLFRSDDTNSMRWPVVQLYRNLLVVMINTFVLNSVYKTLWFFTLFVIFLSHDWYRMPFKHPYLNILQRMTSAALFFVNLCSNPSSFSSIGDITVVPDMDLCLEVLSRVEMGLYVAVPLSFPVWKLWMRCVKKQ